MSNKKSGTITQRIIAIVSDELTVDEEEVTANASLAEDLGADSLDVMEITFALEEEFEIEIGDEEVEKLTTVGKMIDLVTAEQTRRELLRQKQI